jgi:hypothetical protein
MSLDQRCPTVKRHSPQMWRQERLCRHICWQYFVAKIFKNHFFTTINNCHSVSLCTYSKIDLLLHMWFTIFIVAKNVKFKKLSLSPHLNCLSPHVANGDKVGHRCTRFTMSTGGHHYSRF